MADYCTVAQVKEYLGITSNADNALLERLVSTAGAVIETRTFRVFKAPVNDETRTYFTKGRIDADGLEIWIGDDILSITTVTNYDAATVSASNFFQLPLNMTPKTHLRLKIASELTWGCGDDDEYITILGKFAYSSTPPEDIVQAAIRIAAWMYRQKDGGGDMDRPMMMGEGTVILPAILPRDVEVLLKPFIKENYGF